MCLLPGVYELQDPLRLGPERSNLTLEGCHDGVVLTVAAGSENKFADGIIVLNQANNVTLRCLRFKLPQVLKRAGAKLLGLDPSIFGRSSDLFTSIGVRPVHCANLTITDCLFRYSVTPDQHVFGAGIFAGSECWGLKVQGNRFVHEEEDLRNGIVPIRGQDTTSVIRMLIGYVLSPTIASVPRPSVAARPKSRARARASAVTLSEEVRSVLQDAVFHDNAFLGLSIAALVCADCDVVKFEDNTVRESYAGFWIVSLATLKRLPAVAIPTDLLEAMKKKRTAARIVPAPTLTVLNVAAGVVCAYPLPAGFDIHHALRAVRSGGHRLELSLQVANNDIDAFVPNGPSRVPRAPPDCLRQLRPVPVPERRGPVRGLSAGARRGGNRVRGVSGDLGGLQPRERAGGGLGAPGPGRREAHGRLCRQRHGGHRDPGRAQGAWAAGPAGRRGGEH